MLSSQTLTSLSDDIDSVCLICECRDLEEYFDTNFVSAILEDTCPHPREIKKAIVSADCDLMLCQHAARADMSIVVEVERAIGWPRLWDLALDNGSKCIDGLKNLVRVITFPPHATSACPLCERDVQRDSQFCHVLSTHTNCYISSNEFIQELLSISDSRLIYF